MRSVLIFFPLVQGEQMDLTENQNGRMAHLCWRQARRTHVFVHVVLGPCCFFSILFPCRNSEGWTWRPNPLLSITSVSVRLFFSSVFPVLVILCWSVKSYQKEVKRKKWHILQISIWISTAVCAETYSVRPSIGFTACDDKRECQSARHTEKTYTQGHREATRGRQSARTCESAILLFLHQLTLPGTWTLKCFSPFSRQKSCVCVGCGVGGWGALCGCFKSGNLNGTALNKQYTHMHRESSTTEDEFSFV